MVALNDGFDGVQKVGDMVVELDIVAVTASDFTAMYALAAPVEDFELLAGVIRTAILKGHLLLLTHDKEGKVA